MLSSGVEPLLRSSVPAAVLEGLYLPGSGPAGRMALADPRGGPKPALARSEGLAAQLRGTTGVEDLCQEIKDVLTVTSRGPAEPPPEELLEAGGLGENEQNEKRHFRRLDCCSDGCQKEEGGGAEEHRAERCALAPGESWSKQEGLCLNLPEVKPQRTCHTEVAGPQKGTEESQANAQVTAETLPKLTEEVQGMKADGTRLFSKAGYRSDRVSKGLPPESNECPDVDTVTARAGLSETSTLDCLEPLEVMDIESATEHPQETNEYNGLKAHAAVPLRAGGNTVSVLETREEKLPRRNPVNEFRTPLANCQSYQQDEGNNAHDLCTGPVPNHNEPHRLSSVESCRTLSTKSSEALCSVLKSSCYPDFRNMPLENNSTTVHGFIDEACKKYLPKTTESQTHCDHGTGFAEHQTSTSIPAEQVSVVRSEGLPSAKADHREVSTSTGSSYSSEIEEAAEDQRKTAVGGNAEGGNPEAQEGANSEHRHSSVSSSVASSPEEFSQEKLKTVLLEGNKVEKDPWRLPASDLCKEDMKENSLFIEGSDIPSHETGETHTCVCNASSKTSPPSSYGYLDLTKLEKDSPEAQLLEKESESKPTSEGLAGSLVEATEANSNNSLFGGKETSLIYTLNVPLPPVAQKSREPHPNEHPPCTADEVPSRDKAWDNLSGKESIGATGTTEKQVTEIVLHKDKFKSSLCSRRTFDNPSPRSNISQKNMKSSVGNVESVTTASVNEHGDTWSGNNQSIKEECAPGSASCTLSGSARVDDVPPSSYSSKVEEKTEENDNLEGEASVGDNSQKVMVFPEAHFPLACGSLHCEGKWGSRGVDLHGVEDVFAAKSVFCSAHTAQKAAATLVRDEISIKNMEVGKQSDLCEVTDGSEIVCDRGGRKEQMGVCALQADRVGKIRAVDSSEAPEGNHRNKSSEQLSVRYLKKETCVDNFGFCNSSLWPNKRDLGTSEKKELPSPTANPSQFSLSTCSACPLLINTNIQTGHAGQTEKTLHPTENQCLACQSEFDGPVKGNKQHLGRLNNQPETGLQTTAAAGEEGNMSVGSSQSEKAPIEAGDDLPLLAHKYAKDSFRGTLKENVVDLDSLNGVRNEDCSGYVGFISDLIEEKTVKLKEHKSGCEREDKGTPEESFSDSKSHCSQHACFIKCAKENAELLFAGNRMQPSLPKVKWLVGDQENTVSTRSLPFSSVHGSLSHKPEDRHVLSETETKKNLRVKSILKDSCPQLTFEPGEETDAQECIDSSCFGKFDIQESSNETRADSEGPSALNLGIALPEEEELWMLSENTQMDNCDLSSAKVFSKNSSVTKLPGRKASNIETPGNEPNPSFLKGANSSRDCACSKNSLRERHSMLTVKDMDVTSPEIGHCGEKFKNTSVEEKVGREVTYRKKLPKKSFLDGADCLRALLEDSKESGSKIVPLSSEVLEEIPRSNLNNFSKEGENASEPTNLASTCLLSEPVCDCQAEDVSDADPAPKSQCNTAPRFYPCPSIFSNSCKESSPNPVVGSEACVPYKLHAQSKDNIKEVAEGQDTVPTCSVYKENEALGSERLDQVEKHPVLEQKKYEKMGVCLSDKAQQEQKSEYQEKEVTLQPSTSHRSDLLCSCSKESVTARNKKFDSPSEEIFAVRSSENKLCSTLEEVKRPKITTDVTSSQFLKTQDSEMENLNLNLGCDGIPGAFGTTNKLRGPVPLKRQPGRMCKKVPTSHQQSTIRKSKKIKSSPFSEIPPKIFPKPENALLQSLYFPRKPPPLGTEAAVRTGGMPRQGARRGSLLNSLKFRRCTKEPALLGKLSAMASKLLAPAKSIQNLEPRPYSSEILPVAKRCSQRRSKNLLEAFSCINRSLHSRWADSWCTKMFSFQPLALYPVESTKILISDLSHEPPTSFLDTPFFPISFHIKLDSSPVTDRAGITSQHSVHPTPAWGGMPAPPAEWTFSFLLSRGRSDTPVYKEYSSLGNEPRSSLSVRSPRTVALHPDRRRNALAERRGHCSMLGLHTVLALSSPGCYRIWTRRRNLTSHIPTIQRLFISQFAQGLKGARYPTSVPDDLVSSLPYSLGRALSIWSQHGPSARPSEITPLHSSHCKWQPSVGIENSYAVLPHFPAQSMEALQMGGCEIRLETSFPLPLPKSCALPESLPSPSRLPAPELRICALDEADASVPACLTSQDDPELKKIEPEKRPKKVSQIRIRKTVPKPDPNLTPMGLPKPKRLKKKEFSLEEIYTNKNYKSPPPARSLETIFEEPKEKNGRLISVSQQKRKRILEFQDFTLPRKRKTRGKIKAVGSFTRAKKAALQSAELDALLIQKLMDLEAFFATEEEEEEASGI